MSAYNPHFQNVSRAAYELPNLVKKLGAGDYRIPMTEDELQLADAIQAHAYNAIDTIAGGLAAVGQMMSLIATTEHALERDHFAGLGHLIKHLSVELESLRDVEADMQVRVSQSQLAATKAAAAPAPARAKAQRKPAGGTPA